MPPLTYGQIETLLTAMLDIHPDRVSAIGARFNTLRRLGFPEGVNIATGRFKYDISATFSTLVLFGLIDALVLPQQAVALLKTTWPDTILPAVRSLLSHLTFVDGKLERGTRPPEALYLVLRPEALAQLRDAASEQDAGDDGVKKTSYRPVEPGKLELRTPAEIEEQLLAAAPVGVRPPFVMIDLHSIVTWGAQAIVSAGWSSPAGLGARRALR